MSSDPNLISPVIKLLVVNKPQKIMDVGVGYGKYGFLSRLYLELEPYNRDSWQTIIDGIEVFPKYILTEQFYNVIFSKNVTEHVIEGYDVVLLLDVLEHMEKEEALTLLTKIIDKNHAVIVTTPFGFRKQESVAANDYQIHKCGFELKDFRALGLKTKTIDTMIFAHSKNLKTKALSFRKRIPIEYRTTILKLLGKV